MNGLTFPSLRRETRESGCHVSRERVCRGDGAHWRCWFFFLAAPRSCLRPEERAAIDAGEKSLVLIRVQCTVDDQPFEPCLYRRDDSLLSDKIFVGFAMGSFDTFGRPGNTVVRGLSAESYDDGWVVFVLSPGIYYLQVRGPDSSEVARMGTTDYYARYFPEVPRWRIDVPEGAKWIYAGTLHLAGTVRGTLLFGDRIIDPVKDPDASLSDDRELAGRLLAKHFPDADGIRTILMRKWTPGEPIILRAPLPAPNR